MGTVFFLPYLGNIQYYQLYADADAPIIDIGEHYIKQSYRNRALILGANGILPLSVPVSQRGKHHQLMSEVRISYETDWQRMHIEAIRSAYGSSAFFEHYFDDIAAIIRQRYDLLSELSMALHHQIMQSLGIDDTGTIATEYCEAPQKDYRNNLHPKNSLPFESAEYTQVFFGKFGFCPNLSIIDLIFCEGPASTDILLA